MCGSATQERRRRRRRRRGRMEFQDGVLIITDSVSVNATVVEWTLQHFSVGLKDLRIVTQASLLGGNLYFKSSSLSAVISISEKPGFHTKLWLLELAKVLKPGGSVLLQEPSFFDGDSQTELNESRYSLERNLLIAGFSSLEYTECLDHSAEIDSSTSPQNFELIAIQARRPWDTDSSFDTHWRPMRKRDISTDEVASPTLPQSEDMDDLIDDDTFFTAEDSQKSDLPLDNSTVLREHIRKRNRIYQRRRRARMTEEQRERERERRRQYMQSRRVQPVSYEMQLPSLPIDYGRSNDCEQGPLCGQQLRESQGIEMEKNQVMERQVKLRRGKKDHVKGAH